MRDDPVRGFVHASEGVTSRPDGNANNGLLYGVFYGNANNAFSNVNVNNGTGFCLVKLFTQFATRLLRKSFTRCKAL